MNSNRKERIEKIMSRGRKKFILKNSFVFGIVFFVSNWLISLAFDESLFSSTWKVLTFVVMTILLSVTVSVLNWKSLEQERNSLEGK